MSLVSSLLFRVCDCLPLSQLLHFLSICSPCAVVTVDFYSCAFFVVVVSVYRYDNRVVKISVPSDGSGSYSVDWATPHLYNSPHSIALHERSGLLIVADRGHNETRLLRADTGKDLGAWNCGLDFGLRGVPFGVRTLHRGDRDLVLVASMDNPQDHRNQFIHVLDATHLSADSGASSPCTVLQTITIDPAEYVVCVHEESLSCVHEESLPRWVLMPTLTERERES